MIEYWHNPRCSKSRQGLALLQEKGAEIEIVEYLKNPPAIARIKEVAILLGVSPRDMIRANEDIYKELGLAQTSDEQLFEAMHQHSSLIERPIAINGKKAAIGRPPENLLAIL
jgi:arsenate reductase (glutaredoxin)